MLELLVQMVLFGVSFDQLLVKYSEITNIAVQINLHLKL
jgi:hypothetical protein